MLAKGIDVDTIVDVTGVSRDAINKLRKKIMVFLNPQVDLVFKKLFGTPANKDLLIDFLNNILGRKEGNLIVDVVYIDPQNHLETVGQKYSIVDVRCTDQANTQYIVEMQRDNHHDFMQRVQYYGACGLSVQLPKAEKYKELLPIVFVGITKFKAIERHNRYISRHKFIDVDDHVQDLNLVEFYFIELAKFQKKRSDLKTVVDKWIYFLKNASKEDEIPENFTEKSLQKAFRVLSEVGWTSEELLAYQKQRDAQMVEASVLETAGKKAREEGREEGLAAGREEGLREGEEKGLLKTARNMLAKGIDVDTIVDVTGLSNDAINKLRKK